MADLKSNQTYDAFEGMRETAFDLAGTLPEKKKTRTRDIDLERFNNVRDVSREAQRTPQESAGQSYSSQGTPGASPYDLGPVTTPYGGSTKFESYHPGVDIAMRTGQEIPSFTGGKVSEVRTRKRQTPNLPGFGNYVVIKDEQGNKHRYSHLHEAWVEEGQEISPGQSIGGAGHSGGAYSTSGGSGTHLDYRIQDAYERYINPSEYLLGEKGNE